MNDDDERALRKFPDTFRTELAAIQAGARNGGVISPRRHGGLLVEFERVKNRYDAKVMNLRAREPSQAIDEVEGAITKIAAEFAAAISTGKAT
jgi:hypothetical protein